MTWRNNWLSYCESPFSVFDKLCYANHITQKEFHTYFSCVKNKEYLHPFINQIDYLKIEQSISHQITTHFKSSIHTLSHCFYNGLLNPAIYFSKDLYYCNSCSLNGHHSLLFQSKLIKECPFHQTPLTNLCKKCGCPLSYRLYKSQSINQCCRNCNEPILTHHDVYPNYPKYAEQDILSDEVLRLISLEKTEIELLQNINISVSNREGKTSLDFLLYIIEQKIYQRTEAAGL